MTDLKENSRRGISLWPQVFIWSFLLGLLLLLGIGLARAQKGTIQPGDKVPDFSLTFYSGYEYKGQPKMKNSDLRGRVVFINFWASWCKPCEQEAWQHYQPSGK